MTVLRVAALLAALCGVAAWQVTQIPDSLMQMTLGPTLVPAVVVALLSLLTLIYGISAWRGDQADESLDPGQSPLPGAPRRLCSLLAGGVAFMVLLQPLGFIIPGTLCGIGVARAFDAPLKFKTLLIAAAIASAFWVLFAKALGVALGPGLPGLI